MPISRVVRPGCLSLYGCSEAGSLSLIGPAHGDNVHVKSSGPVGRISWFVCARERLRVSLPLVRPG